MVKWAAEDNHQIRVTGILAKVWLRSHCHSTLLSFLTSTPWPSSNQYQLRLLFLFYTALYFYLNQYSLVINNLVDQQFLTGNDKTYREQQSNQMCRIYNSLQRWASQNYRQRGNKHIRGEWMAQGCNVGGKWHERWGFGVRFEFILRPPVIYGIPMLVHNVSGATVLDIEVEQFDLKP